MEKYIETQARTVVKMISWRVWLTISHLVNALVVTGGNMNMALQIAGISAVINSILYWAHERAWNFAQWNRKPVEGLTFNEGQPRTISKILTWRVVITGSNFIVPFFLTGSWGQATAFMSIAILVNIGIFYAHDRVWNRIKWGKAEKVVE